MNCREFFEKYTTAICAIFGIIGVYGAIFDDIWSAMVGITGALYADQILYEIRLKRLEEREKDGN